MAPYADSTRRPLMIIIALSLTAAGCSPPAQEVAASAQHSADLVLVNGGIYTVDAERSRAEAAAIRADQIIAVGSNEMIRTLIGDDTRIIDLTGRTALPGFHDAHVHPLGGGQELLGCSLADLFKQADILAKIAECAEATDEEWVIGENWDLAAFPDGNPHKSLLDAIDSDRPMLMRGSDGHTIWANSTAIALAGITAETPDPDKGVVERDAITGEPTGTLRETAQRLIEDLVPAPSEESNLAAMKTALAELASQGITSFVDARTGLTHWKLYRRLEQSHNLTARVVASLAYGVGAYHEGDEWEAVFAERADYAGERIDTNSVKLYLDGVLEGETGALIEPYVGMGDHRGVLNFRSDELKAAVTRFDALGLQVHMHAIGDLAVREGLDAVEAARAANGETDNRHHIAHLQLVHPDDHRRFGDLGVAANFAALWAYPDPWITGINLPVVGQQRVDRMYPIGSIARAGATIVGGSDWPVSTANVLLAMETGVTRRDPAGVIDAVLNASERVPLETMIEAYTINAARLMRHEDITGSVEAGKKADIVVLDRDIFDVPATKLGDVRVDLTLLDGEVIFERRSTVAAN